MKSLEETQQALAQLWEQQQDVSIRMRAQTDLRQKRQLELEKGVVNKQIQELQMKLDAEKDKEALETLNAILQDNILFIVVECNKTRITAHEYVEIRYSCGHKRRMLLRELIRNFSHHEGKNKPERNYYLLQRWERVLKHNETFNVTFSCEECKKEKQSLKAKFGRLDVRPIGHAHLLVRRLQ